eukprot:654440_1
MTQILIRTAREQIKLHMKFDSNYHTVFDVKKAYCDEHGINNTPDKIMLRNKGKKLQPDSASLASVCVNGRIEILSMSFIMMGGGGVPGPNLNNELKENNFVDHAPDYRVVVKGLNIEFKHN